MLLNRKWDNIMNYVKCRYVRIAMVMLLIFLSGSFAQAQTLGSLHLSSLQKNELRIEKGMKLERALKEVERQFNVVFLYRTDTMLGKKVSNTKILPKDVKKALADLLKGQGLSFKYLNPKTYGIYTSAHPAEPEKMRSVQEQIAGTVTDEQTGETLPGVNILVKGTSTGASTDANGKYELTVPSLQDTLVFTYIGYQRQEVPINGRTEVNIQLIPEAIMGEEMIVIGYGATRRSDLTGSVSSVSSENISSFPVANTTQALQGRAAGVQVQSTNGEPGSSPRIRIRGGTSINASSDPLYVVDGFPGAALPTPEDIESIEILKDASATAIYGSRGANGVVLITTKEGESGDTKIEVNASYAPQRVNNTIDVLNGRQFAQFMNDVHLNDGGDPGNVPYPDPQSYGTGTDWLDEVLRTGSQQNYQLNLSGGKDDFRYYVSGNYYDQRGTVMNSNYERYSARTNLNFDATEKLSVGTNLFFQRSESNGVRTQEGSGGASNTGVISGALIFEPTKDIYDDNGNYTLSSVGDVNDNPYAVASELENQNVNDNFNGNFFAEYELLEDLTFRSTLGARISNYRFGSFTPTTLVAGRNTGGQGNINSNKNTIIINENYLSYEKNFQDLHNVSLMGGYSYQSYRSEYWNATNQNFISNSFSFWNLGGGSDYQSPSSNLTRWKLASWYGRVNYNFNEKYFVTFNGRYDGSSRFGKNNKWAFFPSGALAWNIAEEKFLQDVGILSQFKIRASYGITGNTEIGTYQSLAQFSSGFAVINGSPVNAVRPTEVANPDLTWESTAQLDIGLDIGLWEDRLMVSIDRYEKVTDDLLYEVPLPEYSGYGTSLQNIGSISNKGWEFSVSSNNISGDFEWDTDLNVSMNRNKIEELAGGDIIYNAIPGHIIANESQILREGEPVGAFYGWLYDGLYQQGDDFSAEPTKQPGDVKYVDINGRSDDGELTGEPDGTINNSDKRIIGNPYPDFIYGINNTFKYNNFDLNIFIQGSQGNDMLNFTRMELEWMNGKNNQSTAALDRWTPDNTDTDIPRASSTHNPEVSSRWVEDGSYLRVKNLTLGYNLPASLVNSLQISRARIYFSAQNILTITNYSGFDPEVSYQDSNQNAGLDYGSYPMVKSYTMGINIGF